MFNTILIRPLTNFLIVLYNTVAFKDLGVAVVLFALVIKIILFPLSKKQIESQAKLQKIQPKLKAIQDKHKNDKEEQAKAMMEFWKENKVNPFSGCFPMLIQFPIIIAIFDIFREGLSSIKSGVLYSSVQNPGIINQNFLKVVNISMQGGIIIAIITGVLQYLQMKLAMEQPKGEKTASSAMGSQLMYILPLISALFAYKFPAVLGIYWVAFIGFSTLEHMIIKKAMKEDKENVEIIK